MDLLFLKPFLHFLRVRGLDYTVREYYRILHLLSLKSDWSLEKFRQVLKKVLVKNKDHALIFTQCFEDFFNTHIQTDKALKKDIEHNADIPVILNEVKDYHREARKNPVLSLFTHSYKRVKTSDLSYISLPRIMTKLKMILCFLLIFLFIDIACIFFLVTRLPGPKLSIEPDVLSFTADKKEQQITIKNTGFYEAIIEDIFLDPEPEKDMFVLFSQDEKDEQEKEPVSIKCNESKSYSLSFKGDPDREYPASLVIKSNTKESPQVIPIQIIHPTETIVKTEDDTIQPDRIYEDETTVMDDNKEEIKLPDWIVWAGISAVFLILFIGYILYLYFRKIKIPFFNKNGPTHFSVKNLGGIVEPRLDKQTLDHISDAVGYFLSEKESKKIDEAASIEQTCKKGFPVIRFHFKKQVRKVIILEDQFAQARIWNPIASELVKGLKNRGVPVLHGFFKGIPDEFVLPDNFTYRIEDIEDNKNGCILLFFSDSKGLYHENNSFILEQLSRWDFVAWMELRDKKFWDESTTRVMEHGIHVYPASKQGILDVLDSFTTEWGSVPLPGTIDELLSGKKIKGYHNLPLYIEELLGDSLNWAEDCTLMQPLPLGLADALRRHHGLDHDRIERLFMLPGTIWNAEGIRFSPEVCTVLKTIFYQRRSEQEQKEVLLFILTEMDKQKPVSGSGVKTLKEIDWKWQREKIHLELEPDKALSEIKKLARYPIKTTIELDLENKKTELSEKPGPWVKVQTQKKLGTVIQSIKKPELKMPHYIILGVFIIAFLFFAIMGIWDFLSPVPDDIKVVIKAMAYGGYLYQEDQNWIRIVEAFEAENPNINIDYEMLYDEAYHAKVIARLASGDVPHLAYMGADYRWGTPWKEADQQFDHRPYLDTNYYDMDLIPDMGPNGEIYEIPLGTPNITTVLFMNKKLVEALGFSPPKTYEDLVAMVPAAKEAGLEVVSIDGANGWAWGGCLMSCIIARLSGDAHWVSKAVAGQFRFSDKVFVDSLAMLTRMVDDGVISVKSVLVDYGTNTSIFSNEKALFMVQGQWAAGGIDPDVADNTSMIAWPRFPGEKSSMNGSVAAAIQVGYGITRAGGADPAIRDACFKFIKYYNSGSEVTQRLRDGAIVAPILKNYQVPADLPNIVKQKVKLARAAVVTDVIDAFLYSEPNDALNAGMQEIVSGTATAEEVAKRVADLLMEAL